MLLGPSQMPDPLGRYYTAPWVGKTLVEIMSVYNPKTVLELGVGGGALTSAAKTVWRSSNFVTVDIDPDANSGFLDSIATPNHVHHVQNALDISLPERIGLRLQSVDVAVCNPPYIRPRWNKGCAEILVEAGFGNVFPNFQDVGAEILFTAQNLRFLKRDGKLGLILPDGLIAGEKHTTVRRILLRDHRIDEVIQLPRRAFAGTEAQAHIVVLSKSQGPTTEVKLRRLCPTMGLSGAITISDFQAVERLDYQHYSLGLPPHEEGTTLLGDVVDYIHRGRIMSTKVKSSGFPVFHLGDFPSVGRENFVPEHSLMLPHDLKNNARLKSQIAVPGDIILARVGRNHHQKVCLIKSGHFVISDCIFRLGVQEPFRTMVANFLFSQLGMDLLHSASHGVGAKHLSRMNLLTIPIPSTLFNSP